MMLCVTAASNPVDISSIQNTRAFVTIASPIVTRFFSPPETPLTKSFPMIVSKQFSNDNNRCTLSIFLECTSSSLSFVGVGVAFSCENFVVSLTVKNGKCSSCCVTYIAIRLASMSFSFFNSSAVIFEYVTPFPPLKTALGKICPTAFNKLVFPCPGGANTNVNDPALKQQSTSFKTRNGSIFVASFSFPLIFSLTLFGIFIATSVSTPGTVFIDRSILFAGKCNV
mmetsp:Transcript_5472/g.17292  ORF Transcript_5472/g.17292 Transcript_5472/m.17292 type:complete len:226 (+) Transcript_5472:1935-2612(+)